MRARSWEQRRRDMDAELALQIGVAFAVIHSPSRVLSEPVTRAQNIEEYVRLRYLQARRDAIGSQQ